MKRELDAMFADAVEIRRGMDAPMRRNFDALPNCVQKTLYVAAIPANCNDAIKETIKLEEWDKAIGLLECELGKVWFVTIKPNSPHWRDKGVRDEWLQVCCTNTKQAVECVIQIAMCLFAMKRWQECELICTQTLKLLDSNAADLLVLRAQCRLQVNARDADKCALEDLQLANQQRPNHALTLRLLQTIRKSLSKSNANQKQVFGGIFQQPTAARGLSTIEQEAALLAGLDINNEETRNLLMQLSTDDGRKQFHALVDKSAKQQQWLFRAILFGIGTAVLFQVYLRLG